MVPQVVRECGFVGSTRLGTSDGIQLKGQHIVDAKSRPPLSAHQ